MGQMTIALGAICSTTNKCKDAGACCSTFTATATGTVAAASSTTVCWAAGSAKLAGQVIPVVAPITSSDVTATKGYLLTACAAATTGASTLAFSAAAAATAVYMM